MTDCERLDWLSQQVGWGLFHDEHRPLPNWKVGPVYSIHLRGIKGRAASLRDAIDDAMLAESNAIRAALSDLTTEQGREAKDK